MLPYAVSGMLEENNRYQEKQDIFCLSDRLAGAAAAGGIVERALMGEGPDGRG